MNFSKFLFLFLGVAVRTTMDATITNQYCAVLSRLNDHVILKKKSNKPIKYTRAYVIENEKNLIENENKFRNAAKTKKNEKSYEPD